MSRLFIVTLLFISSLYADVINISAKQLAEMQNNLLIVDIRTKPEWKETGILAQSYPITFFQEDGSYNLQSFMEQIIKLNPKKEKARAIICRSGNRSVPVADFLSQQGYKVYNVQRGIIEWQSQHRPVIPFR